jgi:hypothetical protein
VLVRADDGGAIVMGGHGIRRLDDDTVTGADHDAEANEVAPFEEFMGSHGGLGGWQSRPFALVPASWSEPEAPIVGVRAMHETIRGWLLQTGLDLRPHAQN